MIELSRASCRYADHLVLTDIDLSIKTGESVALIGPNGSGKSTLLKLIAGVVHPHQGTYRFNGHAVTAEALRTQAFAKSLHQRIGLLFQNSDAQLFCPDVETEVAFGPRQMGLDEVMVHERVEDCLSLLEIEHLRSRAHYHLSEGEKRKVALAAVLSLNPDVLLLDEPMNGLDPRTKRSLRSLLEELHQAGKTIICATHEFADFAGRASTLFDRAMVLSEDHRLIRSGCFGEITRDEELLRTHNII